MDEEILEQQGTETPEVEIEVVDDTPEELKQPAGEPTRQKAPDLADDEVSSLSQRAQKRIARLTYEAAEAKRQADAAVRQRQEALRVAQMSIAQQNELAARINELQTGFKQEAISHREAKAIALRNQITKAREEGDTQKEAELFQQLADISASRVAVQNLQFQPIQQIEVPMVVDPPQQQQQQVPQIDDVTRDWAQRNMHWLKTPDAPAVTRYGDAYLEKLQNQGYELGTKECYDKLDEELRRRFPEVVGANTTPPSAPSRPAVINAPRVQTSAPGKQVVRLTKSQVDLADQLGMSHLDYYNAYIKYNGGA